MSLAQLATAIAIICSHVILVSGTPVFGSHRAAQLETQGSSPEKPNLARAGALDLDLIMDEFGGQDDALAANRTDSLYNALHEEENIPLEPDIADGEDEGDWINQLFANDPEFLVESGPNTMLASPPSLGVVPTIRHNSPPTHQGDNQDTTMASTPASDIPGKRPIVSETQGRSEPASKRLRIPTSTQPTDVRDRERQTARLHQVAQHIQHQVDQGLTPRSQDVANRLLRLLRIQEKHETVIQKSLTPPNQEEKRRSHPDSPAQDQDAAANVPGIGVRMQPGPGIGLPSLVDLEMMKIRNPANLHPQERAHLASMTKVFPQLDLGYIAILNAALCHFSSIHHDSLKQLTVFFHYLDIGILGELAAYLKWDINSVNRYYQTYFKGPYLSTEGRPFIFIGHPACAGHNLIVEERLRTSGLKRTFQDIFRTDVAFHELLQSVSQLQVLGLVTPANQYHQHNGDHMGPVARASQFQDAPSVTTRPSISIPLSLVQQQTLKLTVLSNLPQEKQDYVRYMTGSFLGLDMDRFSILTAALCFNSYVQETQGQTNYHFMMSERAVASLASELKWSVEEVFQFYQTYFGVMNRQFKYNTPIVFPIHSACVDTRLIPIQDEKDYRTMHVMDIFKTNPSFHEQYESYLSGSKKGSGDSEVGRFLDRMRTWSCDLNNVE